MVDSARSEPAIFSTLADFYRDTRTIDVEDIENQAVLQSLETTLEQNAL